MQWISVVLTSLISVCALFALGKVMGHKQMAQFDFFDYITGITVGSIAAELATELETPARPMVALLVWGVVGVLLGALMRRVPRSRRYINGTPTVLMDDGRLFRERMKRAHLDLSEFLVLCRQAGYFDLNEVQTAVLEYNGKISILPKSQNRPVCAADLDVATPQSGLATEVVMDGVVLTENLRRLGLDEVWLKRALRQQGASNTDEVFLAVCDAEHRLSVFLGK